LASFPNVKKDATSLAGKLSQPILNLLNEDDAEAVWVSFICCGGIACFIITSF